MKKLTVDKVLTREMQSSHAVSNLVVLWTNVDGVTTTLDAVPFAPRCRKVSFWLPV